MLTIRMQRIGRKNDPAFRVIVAEHTKSPQSGKYVERVGSYNPKTKERVLNADRIKYWISVGAQPTDTVHNMLITENIIEGKKINVLPKKTPIVKEKEEEAAPAEAPAAEATEDTPPSEGDEAPEETPEAPAEEAAPEAETPAEEAPAEESSAEEEKKEA